MQSVEWVPWEDLGWGASAAHAQISGRLPTGLRAPDLRDLADALEREPMSAESISALSSESSPEMRTAWQTLSDPRSRAVVTGQQPGCAGGVLLVLYKAATAVALARRISKETDRPVVSVFWNATDDVDFDEVAQVAWPDQQGGLVFLELPTSGRRAEGFVGNLPPDGDHQAVAAALELVEPGSRGAVEEMLPEEARDHGDWVGQLLRRIFPELLVLDARSPALRRLSAPLFEQYLKRAEGLHESIEKSAHDLQSVGFERTLSSGSLRSGLFLTPGGVRRKSAGNLDALRLAVQQAPETVSPNVLLRPLVQDHLLPTVATVVGPAEIGYLLELRCLRPVLNVPEPALVSRLSCTFLRTAAWSQIQPLVPNMAEVLREPEETLRRAAVRNAQPGLGKIESLFSDFESALSNLQDETGMGSAVQRALKRLRSLRGDLESESAKVALQAFLQQRPELTSLRSEVRPRGKPQERLVAALWLLARWGQETGPRLVELAERHLQKLERLEARHAVVLD